MEQKVFSSARTSSASNERAPRTNSSHHVNEGTAHASNPFSSIWRGLWGKKRTGGAVARRGPTTTTTTTTTPVLAVSEEGDPSHLAAEVKYHMDILNRVRFLYRIGLLGPMLRYGVIPSLNLVKTILFHHTFLHWLFMDVLGPTINWLDAVVFDPMLNIVFVGIFCNIIMYGLLMALYPCVHAAKKFVVMPTIKAISFGWSIMRNGFDSNPPKDSTASAIPPSSSSSLPTLLNSVFSPEAYLRWHAILREQMIPPSSVGTARKHQDAKIIRKVLAADPKATEDLVEALDESDEGREFLQFTRINLRLALNSLFVTLIDARYLWGFGPKPAEVYEALALDKEALTEKREYFIAVREEPQREELAMLAIRKAAAAKDEERARRRDHGSEVERQRALFMVSPSEHDFQNTLGGSTEMDYGSDSSSSASVSSRAATGYSSPDSASRIAHREQNLQEKRYRVRNNFFLPQPAANADANNNSASLGDVLPPPHPHHDDEDDHSNPLVQSSVATTDVGVFFVLQPSSSVTVRTAYAVIQLANILLLQPLLFVLYFCFINAPKRLMSGFTSFVACWLGLNEGTFIVREDHPYYSQYQIRPVAGETERLMVVNGEPTPSVAVPSPPNADASTQQSTAPTPPPQPQPPADRTKAIDKLLKANSVTRTKTKPTALASTPYAARAIANVQRCERAEKRAAIKAKKEKAKDAYAKDGFFNRLQSVFTTNDKKSSKEEKSDKKESVTEATGDTTAEILKAKTDEVEEPVLVAPVVVTTHDQEPSLVPPNDSAAAAHYRSNSSSFSNHSPSISIASNPTTFTKKWLTREQNFKRSIEEKLLHATCEGERTAILEEEAMRKQRMACRKAQEEEAMNEKMRNKHTSFDIPHRQHNNASPPELTTATISNRRGVSHLSPVDLLTITGDMPLGEEDDSPKSRRSITSRSSRHTATTTMSSHDANEEKLSRKADSYFRKIMMDSPHAGSTAESSSLSSFASSSSPSSLELSDKELLDVEEGHNRMLLHRRHRNDDDYDNDNYDYGEHNSIAARDHPILASKHHTCTRDYFASKPSLQHSQHSNGATRSNTGIIGDDSSVNCMPKKFTTAHTPSHISSSAAGGLTPNSVGAVSAAPTPSRSRSVNDDGDADVAVVNRSADESCDTLHPDWEPAQETIRQHLLRRRHLMKTLKPLGVTSSGTVYSAETPAADTSSASDIDICNVGIL